MLRNEQKVFKKKNERLQGIYNCHKQEESIRSKKGNVIKLEKSVLELKRKVNRGPEVDEIKILEKEFELVEKKRIILEKQYKENYYLIHN